MANDHNVTLKITVSKGTPETLVVSEEAAFTLLSFARMTHISSEFYELVAKLIKEKS